MTFLAYLTNDYDQRHITNVFFEIVDSFYVGQRTISLNYHTFFIIVIEDLFYFELYGI